MNDRLNGTEAFALQKIKHSPPAVRETMRNGEFFLTFIATVSFAAQLEYPKCACGPGIQPSPNYRIDGKGRARPGALVLFPELGLTAYSCEIYFTSRHCWKALWKPCAVY